MKRAILMLLSGLSYCISYAQNNDTLKVHQGTYIQSFPLSSIDSITHDGGQFVSIYHNEQMSAYSVNNVDSIVIQPTTGVCYQIPEGQLNGWAEGIYYAYKSNKEQSIYILSQDELEEGYTIVCLNSTGNKDNNDALKLVLGPNSEIQDVFIGNYQFEAHPNNDEIIFFVYDQERNAIGLFSVPYADDEDVLFARVASSKRADAHLRNPNLRRLFRCINLYQNYDFLNNLSQGRYGDILEDFLLDRLVSLADLPFLAEFMSAEALKLFVQQLYENNKNWFMGSAGIEITSIKRASKSTISVEGEISNISTIPSTRLVPSEYFNYIDGKLVKMREVPNYVLYGVAEGDSGQPGLYLHDACTTPVVVSGSHFSCTLPVEHKPGKTFYFRPFLIPEAHFEESADLGQAIGNLISTNIRYGNRKEYTDQKPTCSTGDVVSKTSTSAVVNCSYSNVEGFECGVMVSSEEGMKPFKTSSTEGAREVNLTALKPSTTYNYWAYVDYDDTPINGVVKSFTTKSASLAGTWSCTITRSSGVESWTITLTEDGKGNAKRTDTTSANFEASWNVRADGQAHVGFVYTLSTPQRFSYQTYSLQGTVNSIYNPTSISGNGEFRVGNDITESGPYSLTFSMSK